MGYLRIFLKPLAFQTVLSPVSPLYYKFFGQSPYPSGCAYPKALPLGELPTESGERGIIATMCPLRRLRRHLSQWERLSVGSIITQIGRENKCCLCRNLYEEGTSNAKYTGGTLVFYYFISNIFFNIGTINFGERISMIFIKSFPFGYIMPRFQFMKKSRRSYNYYLTCSTKRINAASPSSVHLYTPASRSTRTKVLPISALRMSSTFSAVKT